MAPAPTPTRFVQALAPLRRCANPECSSAFLPYSSLHVYCCDFCRRRHGWVRTGHAPRRLRFVGLCWLCCHHVSPTHDRRTDNLHESCWQARHQRLAQAERRDLGAPEAHAGLEAGT